ncbi:MAG: MoaD/ThiS family protein [Spirochaetia bacterium]|nr:MoaD/ThiS family protein [Spirochaetia bacterium]
MEINVRTYAALKDHFTDSFRLNVSQDSTIDDMKKKLKQIKPSSADLLEKCRFAINQEFAACAARLTSGDTIDILPPSSGG